MKGDEEGWSRLKSSEVCQDQEEVKDNGGRVLECGGGEGRSRGGSEARLSLYSRGLGLWPTRVDDEARTRLGSLQRRRVNR